jgi:hypothetical protein
MKGYETSDADARKIFWVAGIFIVVGAVIYVAIWWMFAFYRTEYGKRDQRQTLIEAPPQLPPEPRLQVNPELDWDEYRQTQERLLSSYGWASREQRRVRIPIDRAMEMVAGEGVVR